MAREVAKCDIMEMMRKKILILDGAMGTCIQRYNLTPDDFLGGKGNNDILNLTREDVIASIHNAYVEAGADIIMLDNMSAEDMKTAVKMVDGKAQTECSGNVTKENIAKLVDIGVDFISSGALTHSAPIMDLSLKNLHAI